MSSSRNMAVDALRGFAVLLIILIHITVYFRNDFFASIVWEYSQVAVPIFVFCSAYLYFKKPDEPLSISYFLKRIKRLVIPYYMYLLILFLYTIILKKQSLSFSSVLNKLLFLNVNSYDIDWLVVLFLAFMVFMPIIRWLSQRPLSLWLFAIVSFVSSIYLLFTYTNFPFRTIMWLPWTLVLIMSYIVARYEKTRWFFPSSISIFLGLYLICRGILIYTDHSLSLRANKYPPNLFYLSYGIALLLFLYAMYPRFHLEKTMIQKCFNFLSTYSYSIFFIHFLLLYSFIDFVDYKKMYWWGLFGVILALTIVVQMVINYFFSILKKAN